MSNPKAARRYATAVFSLALEKNAVTRIGDDLSTVASLLEENPQAGKYFLSPVVDRAAKTKFALAMFEDHLDLVSLHTLLLLIQKRREALLPEILLAYQKLALDARALEPLVITSARSLERAELDTMVAKLSATYGKQFDVRQEVDPSLIGGVRILLGDRRIDGSISGRLEELAATLFSQS